PDLGRGLRTRLGTFDIANQILADGVEAIGVTYLAGESGERSRCFVLPYGERSTIVRCEYGEESDAGASVGSGPLHQKADARLRRWQRNNMADRGRDVDGVRPLRRGDRRIGIEDDIRLVVDHGPRSEAGFRHNGERDAALPGGWSGVGGQKAHERILRQLQRVGVDGVQLPSEQPRSLV